jgi:hypothetical protein
MATYWGDSISSFCAVQGTSASGFNFPPIQGYANGTSNAIYGKSGASSYGAIAGVNTATTGFGVFGEADAANGRGVYGYSAGTSGIGVCGIGAGTTSFGIYGSSTVSSGYGVYGTASATSSTGVYGVASGTNSNGVWGSASAAGAYALYALATSSAYTAVYVDQQISGGTAVYAYTLNSAGYSFQGYGALFNSGNGQVTGNFSVLGTLTKTAGSFLIDHPSDPANRYLEHSFVESPERKNIYDGVATADAAGELTVALPGYFDVLNEDVRYQLTPIGGPAANLHIKEEIRAGKFVVAGAAPGQRISWQVTGNRCDPWVKANPLRVERDKPAEEKGRYLHPELYKQPPEKGLGHRERLPGRDLPPKGPV